LDSSLARHGLNVTQKPIAGRDYNETMFVIETTLDNLGRFNLSVRWADGWELIGMGANLQPDEPVLSAAV
jgi:hypothetical protein